MLQIGKRRRAARNRRRLRAVCTLCAQEIYPGETLWHHSGTTVCADCFARFAREELKCFEYILGEETVE